MTEPFIPSPDHRPFYAAAGFRVWEMSEGHYLAAEDNGPLTYRGDLAGCARWIARHTNPKGA